VERQERCQTGGGGGCGRYDRSADEEEEEAAFKYSKEGNAQPSQHKRDTDAGLIRKQRCCGERGILGWD
jgi:hypothetical protein